MKTKITCLVLFLTLFTTSLTYANTNNNEDSVEDNYVTSILGKDVVEDIITRQLAFMKAPSISIYTVQQGDNLFRIALNHDVSLLSLMEWNNLENTLIHPGDVLIIRNDEIGTKNFRPISIVADVSGDVLQKAVPKESTKTNTTPKKQVSVESEPQTGKEMIVTATAYTAYCEGCSGKTAYGLDLRANPDMKVIAVDPKVIPLGTKVWVEGYGVAIAGDTGGAIKGNKIDVFIPSHDDAMDWGVKKVKIKVLE